MRAPRRTLATALVLAAMGSATWGSMASAEDLAWVYDDAADRVLRAPPGYVVDRVISVPLAQKGLKAPQDLFIDGAGHLWVVDSGNGRVLEMTREGRILSVLPSSDDPAAPSLRQPTGVFVDRAGRIYVTDTGNSRIVVFGPDHMALRTLGKPESLLLERDFSFKPTKLLVDNRGYVNVINEGDYRGILLMDLDGNFRGFFGTNPVGFDWRRLLLRVLATEAQLERTARVLPPPHSNLAQDAQGLIYTTTVHATRGEIKRFNSIGRNTYPVRRYGFSGYMNDTEMQMYFTDLAVDGSGIVTVVDATWGFVLQYDQDGRNLTIFGGMGESQGRFLYPSAIAVDEAGYLYVADREQNLIQVFRPTEFMRLVHQASRLYYDGRYEEAGEPWRAALRLNSHYPIAHRGLGRALLKQGRLEEAMQEFRLGKDRAGYSRAFGELRYRWMRAHFGATVAIFAGALVVTWLGFRLAGRITRSARRYYGGYV